ncbi:MAG: hypothetical protein HOE11_04835 [Candidatus Diapherotrites archaeon]|jgi:hypothetical protein|nr:hypothetical protein [Candidatus Diapherotrites archaeon]MBT4597321.1 hypothetical protein [Candidatus Diapherotrites archaeon]
MKKTTFLLIILILAFGLIFGCNQTDNPPDSTLEITSSPQIEQTNNPNENKTPETYSAGQGTNSLLALLPKEQGNLSFTKEFRYDKSSAHYSYKSLFSEYGNCKFTNSASMFYTLHKENIEIVIFIGELNSQDSAKQCLEDYWTNFDNLQTAPDFYYRKAQIFDNIVTQYIWNTYSGTEKINEISYVSDNKIVYIITGHVAYDLTAPEQQLPGLFTQLFQKLPSDNYFYETN